MSLKGLQMWELVMLDSVKELINDYFFDKFSENLSPI